MPELPAVQLPLLFDAARLSADLARAGTESWISHYRPEEYEGDWAILPLRSVAGHPAIIHAVPGAGQEGFYKNTPLLDCCPYFREVLGRFECPVGAARLMRLGPGARILEHSDDMGEGPDEEWRIHIPVQTHPDVCFRVNGEKIPMGTGECWYADFGLPHSVENNSPIDRVHLVLDCRADDWLRAQRMKGTQVARIRAFLNLIGIDTRIEALPADTFLPGLAIEGGGIRIDLEKLLYPGDILHEAGHIAVTMPDERSALSGNLGENDPNGMGQEIAAILWSYAALQAVGLPEEVVFHENGYKGQSDWYINCFRTRQFIGLPLLEWMGMTVGEKKAEAVDAVPFPNMLHWLRPAPG